MAKIDRLSATLSLEEGVGTLKGVSTGRISALGKLGIRSIRDLLTHYPRRYIDLTSVRTVASASIGEMCTIAGQVVDVKFKRPRYNLPIVEVSLNDGTATMIATFFRQPWLKDKVKVGQSIIIAGRTEFNYGFLRMSNPFMEIQEDSASADASVGRMVAVHPATAKLSAAQMRKTMRTALDSARGMFDPVPIELRMKRNLMGRGEAFEAIHFPSSMEEVGDATRRLVYDELLAMQLFLMRSALERSMSEGAVAHSVDGPAVRALEEHLPFELTRDQRTAAEAMLVSLGSPRATSRMILGDVGTGKTIVAAIGLAAVADTGTQAFLMAPTEVLAQQHHASLSPLLEGAGVRCALLTGSTTREERASILEALASGSIDVLIGTHALLEDDVVPKHLSLVVIDEQQRFGVGQRAKLLEKGAAPDALYLTATPIPRTLALALFGGLELSYIREKPMARATRTTTVLERSRRGIAYDAAKEALSRGEQVYVVCPLIGIGSDERKERSEKKHPLRTPDEPGDGYAPDVVIEDVGDFGGDDAASAIKEAEFLQSKVFVDHKVGLLHGGMPSEEKQRTMGAFHDGEIDVLVSTTVIEVGIDVPRATVMIIEDADRFGLSQLHQLRGRVGRSDLDSEVYLISASESEDAIARLRKLEQSDDGFEISAFDLSLRREGDLLGYRQSGTSVLKLVDITRDGALVEEAHEDAAALLAEDPALQSSSNAPIARELRLLFDDEAALDAG